MANAIALMLQPEQILDQRYQLKQQLGQAPGRQTWLADDRSRQPAEPVVMKFLVFGAGITQWEDVKLFEREAQVLQQLHHPQIPKYRDSFAIVEPQHWFVLVQDYIPGHSLKQLLEQGKHFTERQVQQIAVNLLYLLAYLHELSPPVLHRDIKPSNLIWGTDNFIYLVDFGAVQNRAAREGATFTVVGTYGYAPLEQFGGRAVPASDLYALGATLIHLLTGVSPAELPQKDLKMQFADRVSLNPHLVHWIERLVEPDVTKRFQTARQALEALRSPAPELPATTAETSAPTSPTPVLATRPEHLLQPPLTTDIEVYQTPEELTIQLPGTSPLASLLLLPITIGVVALAQFLTAYLSAIAVELGTIVTLLTITGWIGSASYGRLLPTVVHFDRQQFSISKRLFNWILPLDNGSTTTIAAVSQALKLFQSGSTSQEEPVVILQTSDGERLFGRGLSQEECAWVVDVIQQWLG